MNLNVESLSGQLIAKQHFFHISDKICVDLPRMELSLDVLQNVKPYVLADPTFHKPVLIPDRKFIFSSDCD